MFDVKCVAWPIEVCHQILQLPSAPLSLTILHRPMGYVMVALSTVYYTWAASPSPNPNPEIPYSAFSNERAIFSGAKKKKKQ